jgi:outer membrane lipoprotein carrier protein
MTTNRCFCLVLAFVVSGFSRTSVASSLSPAQSSPSPTELAAALQKKYDGVSTFSADFTHQHEGGPLRRKMVEQGTVQVKKPGRMRWDYKSPEKKLFVSDGTSIYFHDIPNNQVTVSQMPQGDDVPSAALFLLGKGNLVRDFTPSMGTDGAPDTYVLRLVPKREQADYDWLELTVDRKTLQLRGLTAAEKQGGRTTFVFTNFKENVDLTDKTFMFRIPPGAEVIHAGRTKR